MGYIKNHAIVVTSSSADHVSQARMVAREIFAERAIESIVGEIVPHAINGGAAFFIAPDGSKEGWSDSNNGDSARDDFKDWMRSSGLYLDWAEIVIGGDDGAVFVAEITDF